MLKEHLAAGIHATRLRNGQGGLLAGQTDMQAALLTHMHSGPQGGEMESAFQCAHSLERN